MGVLVVRPWDSASIDSTSIEEWASVECFYWGSASVRGRASHDKSVRSVKCLRELV
jgi:hypothetical protein